MQIAKSFGAHVTAVCSTRNTELVRSIGAGHVIDYAQQDFTKATERYDTFLDNVGNRSLSACRRLLNSRGTYIAAGGSTDPWMIRPLARMVIQLLLSRLGSQKLVAIFAKSSQNDLTILCDLMKAGRVVPVIDKTYAFSELREAIRYVETGHARGKVVVGFD